MRHIAAALLIAVTFRAEAAAQACRKSPCAFVVGFTPAVRRYPRARPRPEARRSHWCVGRAARDSARYAPGRGGLISTELVAPRRTRPSFWPRARARISLGPPGEADDEAHGLFRARLARRLRRERDSDEQGGGDVSSWAPLRGHHII